MTADGILSPRRDVVIAATVIVVAMIAAVTWLTLAGRSTAAILTIVVPLVLAVLVFFGARISAVQQQIQTQVNGNQSAQFNAVVQLAHMLAAAQPVTVADAPESVDDLLHVPPSV